MLTLQQFKSSVTYGSGKSTYEIFCLLLLRNTKDILFMTPKNDRLIVLTEPNHLQKIDDKCKVDFHKGCAL
jgi:hypothetical protein